ncbi:MAG: PASTA domain-containing protein [Oscillospiraceae bacterium]
MEKIKLCLGCMEVLGDNERVCHHCGYSNNSNYNSSYIAPGTILNNERYTIGKLLKYNGESALYMAYDNNMGCKVIVKEYMPIGLCSRDSSSSNIIINDKYCVQYKSLMAEFTDLNRSLVKLRSLGNITQVLDLFSENNTSYAVYEYTEGITLSQYLKENMGELTWDETSKLFPKLLTTIGLLHQAGIIHRAISPETIYYTSRNELMLTDFSISAVRTKDTELVPEIFKGYSAPEQYTVSGKQGTWTDVYSISAILYKILTGCMPTEAINRLDHNSLCSPIEINLDIPESVSNAIMNGMAISIDKRIQTVTDLVTALFKTVEKKEEFSSTIQIPRRMLNDENNSIDKNQPTPSTEYIVKKEVADDEKPSFFDKIKFPLMIGFLLLAIILILSLVFINMFSTTDETSTSSLLEHRNEFIDDDVIEVTGTTKNTQVTLTYLMKNLINKDIADVKTDSEIQDKLKFDVEFEYNDEYEKDKVFEQSIAIGQKYHEGDTIKLKVSKGPRTIEVPDYKTSTMSTYTKDDYVKMLDSKNIPYELIAVINKSSKDGYVIGTEPKVGETLDLEKGDVLKVTYTNNPQSEETVKSTTYSIRSTTIATTEKTYITTSKSEEKNNEDKRETYNDTVNTTKVTQSISSKNYDEQITKVTSVPIDNDNDDNEDNNTYTEPKSSSYDTENHQKDTQNETLEYEKTSTDDNQNDDNLNEDDYSNNTEKLEE